MLRRWIALLLSIALGGCAAAGVIAYKVAGPPKVDAKYTPAKTPMLVLVENFRHQSSAQADADLLARYTGDLLEANKVAPIVDLDRIYRLRDARPDEYRKMSISAIGQAVNAKQVLYVQLINSDVVPLQGGEALQGSASVRVKVVDVETGNTLWPTDVSEGYPLATATKLGSTASSSAMDIRQRMYRTLSDDISKLFYKWTPEDLRPEDMR